MRSGYVEDQELLPNGSAGTRLGNRVVSHMERKWENRFTFVNVEQFWQHLLI
jgi:hypothetical protein